MAVDSSLVTDGGGHEPTTAGHSVGHRRAESVLVPIRDGMLMTMDDESGGWR